MYGKRSVQTDKKNQNPCGSVQDQSILASWGFLTLILLGGDPSTGFCQEVLPEFELKLYFGPNNMFWNKKLQPQDVNE